MKNVKDAIRSCLVPPVVGREEEEKNLRGERDPDAEGVDLSILSERRREPKR